MATLSVPAGYERLDHAGVRRWLAAHPALSARLGGAPDTWRIDEVSDGNLNVVYVVRGSAGGVCVKQSLPYVRVAGESWPMPLERAYFEQLYLRTSEPHVDGLHVLLQVVCIRAPKLSDKHRLAIRGSSGRSEWLRALRKPAAKSRRVPARLRVRLDDAKNWRGLEDGEVINR